MRQCDRYNYANAIVCPECGFKRSVKKETILDEDWDKRCNSCLSKEKIHKEFPVGATFDNWTVIDKEFQRGHTAKSWQIPVQCICGAIKYVTGYTLRSRASRQCSECSHAQLLKGYELLSVTYFHQIRRAAERRKIPFDVTIEQMWNQFIKQKGICALSGLELVLTNSNHFRDHTASLDRIDSSSGYREDNIQWIHKIINKMKMDFNQESFIEWCTKIANHKNK
jgi:hypothetical protein